ncbi:hypothetical protein SAMN05428977_101235 [Nitrosomonas sp. Nm166]|nr:hypothetical protein SAMN05428977_101235 [Nitrosomonas sp. Nm166]
MSMIFIFRLGEMRNGKRKGFNLRVVPLKF